MSNRLSICAHCGQPVKPKSTEWNFSEWRITTEFGSIILKSQLHVKIFDLLWRKQGMKGLTRERITEIIYADDIDGGSCSGAISDAIRRMRKYLEDIGIFLKRGTSTGNGFSLLFLTPKQAKLNHKEQGRLSNGKNHVSKRRTYNRHYRKLDELEPVWMTKRRERK